MSTTDREKQNEYNRAYYARNREMIKAKQNAKSAEKRAAGIRNTYHLSRFNMTVGQYDEMREAQGYRCAACGLHENELTKALAVDHDHRCCPESGKSCGDCVVALLCARCNMAEGKFTSDELAGLLAYMLSKESEFIQHQIEKEVI